MGVRFLGGEDALGKGMAAHASVLAWRAPWAEGPGGLQSVESHRDMVKGQHTCTLMLKELSFIAF